MSSSVRYTNCDATAVHDTLAIKSYQRFTFSQVAGVSRCVGIHPQVPPIHCMFLQQSGNRNSSIATTTKQYLLYQQQKINTQYKLYCSAAFSCKALPEDLTNWRCSISNYLNYRNHLPSTRKHQSNDPMLSV